MRTLLVDGGQGAARHYEEWIMTLSWSNDEVLAAAGKQSPDDGIRNWITYEAAK